MTNKIIALVDGSIYSESVCNHAAWIAQKIKAPVELIHVLGRREAPDKPDLSGALRLGARTKLMEELAELDAQRAKLVSRRGRAILEDARAIVDQDGVSEITTRLRHGDIVEAIAEIEGDAGVIVIGKRGEAADFAKGHLGSRRGAPTRRAPAAHCRCIAGGAKGSEVSPGSLRQDHLVQRQIRHRPPQPLVLRLQRLELFSTDRGSCRHTHCASGVGVLRHADLPNRVGDRPTLALHNLNLPKLQHDVLGLVSPLVLLKSG